MDLISSLLRGKGCFEYVSKLRQTYTSENYAPFLFHCCFRWFPIITVMRSSPAVALPFLFATGKTFSTVKLKGRRDNESINGT